MKLGLASLLDKDSLAGEDITDILESQLAEGDALGCQHPICGAFEGR